MGSFYMRDSFIYNRRIVRHNRNRDNYRNARSCIGRMRFYRLCGFIRNCRIFHASDPRATAFEKPCPLRRSHSMQGRAAPVCRGRIRRGSRRRNPARRARSRKKSAGAAWFWTAFRRLAAGGKRTRGGAPSGIDAAARNAAPRRFRATS